MADAEFEKLYHITAKKGIYLLTDECYSHFLYGGKPFSIASMPDAKSHGTGRRDGLKNLRDDRLAHRLRPRPRIRLSEPSTSSRATPPRTRLRSPRRPPSKALRGPQDSVPLMLAENTDGAATSSCRASARSPASPAPCPPARSTAYPNLRGAPRQRWYQDSARVLPTVLLKEGEASAVVPGEAFRLPDHHVPHLLRHLNG